jgi:transposase-like protein
MEHMVKKEKESGGLNSNQFTDTLKRKIVAQIESGELTAAEAKAKYQIGSPRTLKGWVIRFAANPDLDIRVKHQYKPSHRRQVAFEIAAGRLTLQQAARENKVGPDAIQLWTKEFKAETQSTAKKLPKRLSGETSTLQDAALQLKYLQLKVIALETMIDIAEKEFDIDIRKKSGTKQ